MALLLGSEQIKSSAPEFFLTRKEIAELKSIKQEDLGYGYDRFGMDINSVIFFYSLVHQFIYNNYLKVDSSGHENIPKTGPVVLAANNAGTVAYDGMMIVIDLLKHMRPQRLCRTIVDRKISRAPYLNVLLQRCGQVIGTHRNYEQLIEAGEMVLNFPESRRGFKKPWTKRHHVEPFNVGFFEIAYKYRAPIIPTAIVVDDPKNRALRVAQRALRPFSPKGFPPLLLPIPGKYTIRYGEPILLHEIVDGYVVSRPDLLDEVVDVLRSAIQDLIDGETTTANK